MAEKMAPIIPINRLKPHCKGYLACLECEIIYLAIWPEDTFFWECPDCKLMRCEWAGEEIPFELKNFDRIGSGEERHWFHRKIRRFFRKFR